MGSESGSEIRLPALEGFPSQSSSDSVKRVFFPPAALRAGVGRGVLGWGRAPPHLALRPQSPRSSRSVLAPLPFQPSENSLAAAPFRSRCSAPESHPHLLPSSQAVHPDEPRKDEPRKPDTP